MHHYYNRPTDADALQDYATHARRAALRVRRYPRGRYWPHVRTTLAVLCGVLVALVLSRFV